MSWPWVCITCLCLPCVWVVVSVVEVGFLHEKWVHDVHECLYVVRSVYHFCKAIWINHWKNAIKMFIVSIMLKAYFNYMKNGNSRKHTTKKNNESCRWNNSQMKTCGLKSQMFADRKILNISGIHLIPFFSGNL